MRKTFWKVLGLLSLLAGVSLLMQAPGVFATRPPDKQLEFIIGTAALVELCGLFAIAWLKSRLGLMNDYEIEFAIALIPSSSKIISLVMARIISRKIEVYLLRISTNIFHLIINY